MLQSFVKSSTRLFCLQDLLAIYNLKAIGYQGFNLSIHLEGRKVMWGSRDISDKFVGRQKKKVWEPLTYVPSMIIVGSTKAKLMERRKKFSLPFKITQSTMKLFILKSWMIFFFEFNQLIKYSELESILPNFDFFVFPIFVFKLGHFKVRTIFSHGTNTQA